MSKYFRILSIDGGRIRGLLPAMIIAELECHLRQATGKPDCYISDYFDRIAGTSTGGILACYYLYNNNGSRLDATKAVDMYEKHGATIFKNTAAPFLYTLFRCTIPFKRNRQYPERNIRRCQTIRINMQQCDHGL